jgi:FkbM family methyltransferase
MGYEGVVLRAADTIASTVFFASRKKPTFYCGGWTWIPSSMWQSLLSRYELAVARAIRDHLKEGQKFWDIGANIGWFSIFASSIVGPRGQVIAIEPSPQVFATLSAHVKAEKCISALWLGVGNADDMRLFAEHGHCTYSSFVEEVTKINVRFAPSVPITQVEVGLRKVDSLVAELASVPSVIKIDVEGYELEVLRGAANLLSSGRPVLIVEVHPPQLQLSGSSEEALFQFLADAGYRWEIIDRNPNSLYTIVAARIELVCPSDKVGSSKRACTRRGQRPQSSSASRITAGAFGFLTFTQCGERPER